MDETAPSVSEKEALAATARWIGEERRRLFDQRRRERLETARLLVGEAMSITPEPEHDMGSRASRTEQRRAWIEAVMAEAVVMADVLLAEIDEVKP